MLEFGVDEAGKGPVLGSMFAAAVVADPADLPDDVGDSKGIAPARREDLAASIRDGATAVAVAEIPVERIDDDGTDMNSLTVAAHADALADAARAVTSSDDVEPLPGYVDACDTSAERFERRVENRLGKVRGDAADGTDGTCDPAFDLSAEHGADESRPLVGAASVVAKVERDSHVERLADRHGDLGSGYPSDPATREFLATYVAAHDSLPNCARSSWKTCNDIIDELNQDTLTNFEEVEGN